MKTLILRSSYRYFIYLEDMSKGDCIPITCFDKWYIHDDKNLLEEFKLHFNSKRI